jgi:hypothetical protein
MIASKFLAACVNGETEKAQEIMNVKSVKFLDKGIGVLEKWAHMLEENQELEV